MKTQRLTDPKTGNRWRIGPGGVDILPPLVRPRLFVDCYETQSIKRGRRTGWGHRLVKVYVRLYDSDHRAVLREHYCGTGWWSPKAGVNSALGKARAEADQVWADWRREWLGIEPEETP